jgi:hypothetical protein
LRDPENNFVALFAEYPSAGSSKESDCFVVEFPLLFTSSYRIKVNTIETSFYSAVAIFLLKGGGPFQCHNISLKCSGKLQPLHRKCTS